MIRNILLSFLLLSCAKHAPHGAMVPNMHDLSEYAGPAFVTSYSPCLDGLLVNLGAGCETLIEIEGRGDIVSMQCHKAKDKNGPWDKYTFTIVKSHNIPVPPGHFQFCVDPVGVIYMMERP